MVERDHDHVVFAREICAVKRNLTARGIAISAAVQPNHDGAFVAHAKSRGPDVKDQAVFAGGLMTVASGDFGNERRGGLGTAMAEVECVADSGPRLRRNRRKESTGAIGGSGV